MSDEFTDRTTSTTERGPRNPEDRRTHTERINGTGPGRFGPPIAGAEPEIDYGAPRRPFRTGDISVFDGVRLPPGSTVWLQPHQVADHHRALPFFEDAPEAETDAPPPEEAPDETLAEPAESEASGEDDPAKISRATG